MEPLIDSTEIPKSYSTINGEDQNIDDEIPKIATQNSNFWLRFIEKWQGLITGLILFVLAILNMTDRYIISSVIIEIQKYFKVSKSSAGFLQTIYLFSFMAFSPLNGYLGDRINRKYLLITSIIIWSISVVGGSFIGPKHFHLFVFSRAVFGVATASFETIGVPIIGDRFKHNTKLRDRAIIAYTVGPGIGAGLAYMISLIAKDLFPNDWRYAMRFSPFVLVVVFFIILIAYIEPERAASKETPLVESAEIKSNQKRKSYFLKDLKVIIKNRTLVMLVFSWTGGLATVGAFQWWSSTMIEYSLSYHKIPLAHKANLKKLYSLIQAFCGIIGLISPSFFSKYFKKKGNDLIDCYLLSLGFFLSAFFLYIYLITIEINVYLTILVSIPLTLSFSMSWLTGISIFLDIVHPSIRATAISLFFFVLHSVGDSISPYWVGLIADSCIRNSENTVTALLGCIRISYYPLIYLSFFSGALGLFASFSFRKDKENALNYHGF